MMKPVTSAFCLCFLTTLFFLLLTYPAHGLVHTITTEGLTWSPDDITISVGDTVLFSGLGNGFHQAVALSSLDCSTASERSDIFSCLSGNECTVGPFTNTGDIPFKCIPHCSSGMVGVIRVVPEGSQLNTTNSSLPFGGDGGDDYYWVTVHGGLMSVAWMALVPLSIAIARYGKSIGVWWFRLHAVLGLMIIAVTTAGFIIIEVKYPVDYDDHVILGLIVFIGMYLQVILGGAIDLLYKPDRKSTPWHDIVHWIFGLILLIISWVAIPLGFEYYSDDRYGGEHAIQGSFIAYGVAAFFIIVCFVILEIWKQFFASKPAE